ncbi:hypothetical protein [Myroides pelagicus]|uniref:Lipocalin-like domain-containing protein n=1 Tax=Myroides pelagicus TaxID=270914 RepID=A0A7K1GP59_9FLAO|nr:hypothetical protein [Myroides pelagicus]MEC4114993.1 hypothetical protein [Myroides pelagicus]MTH30682.1 hypothetical protein [Myroides pelagicus]
MRKFKSILYLLFFSLLFASCSNDDLPYSVPGPSTELPETPEPVEKDILVAKWTVNGLFLNDMDLQLNDCEKTATIDFKEDGTLEEHIVEFDCKVREGEFLGTWKKVADNNYEIRTSVESSNAYFNDAEFFEMTVVNEQTIRLSQELQNEGENAYVLTLELVKK